MNELQIVLLAFAVIVIAVLYFFSKKRQQKPSKADSTDAQQQANPNDLSAENRPHAATSNKTDSADQADSSLEMEEEVPENQIKLSFGDDFEKPAASKSTDKKEQEVEPVISDIELEGEKKGGKHHVLEVEELFTVGEVGETVDDLPKPNFGIPEDTAPAATQTPSPSQGEHQVFALLVLSTGGSGQEFDMEAVNQALLGVGLSFSNNQIYVTTDSQGKEIIRVANIMEPGTFPTENLHTYTTPGLALILELPTSLRAPAAMHDLIMIARKVSQRLNGRLYNVDRHLIKESDLQAMRDAAVEYESEPL